MAKKAVVLLILLSLILSLAVCPACLDGESEPAEEETPDTTPPVISNVTVMDITDTAAKITWSTDEPATSQVEYGLTTSYGSTTTLSATLTRNHSVQLTDLSSTYHFRVMSKDSSDNEAVSGDNTFITSDSNDGQDSEPAEEDTTQPDEIEPVEILSHSSYLSGGGHFKVVGEVSNVSSDNLRFVQLTATFYDSSDIVIDTDFTFSTIDILTPGQKSPFRLHVLDEVVSASVDHYRLVVADYDVTTTKPYRELDILSHTSRIDTSGNYDVVGELENTGTQEATFVQVIGTFYDAAGGVVAADFTFTNPHDLAAGQVAPFELSVLDDTIAATIASYELQVDA